MCTVHQII